MDSGSLAAAGGLRRSRDRQTPPARKSPHLDGPEHFGARIEETARNSPGRGLLGGFLSLRLSRNEIRPFPLGETAALKDGHNSKQGHGYRQKSPGSHWAHPPSASLRLRSQTPERDRALQTIASVALKVGVSSAPSLERPKRALPAKLIGETTSYYFSQDRVSTVFYRRAWPTSSSPTRITSQKLRPRYFHRKV